MVTTRIAAFVADEAHDDFTTLARDAHAYQVARIPAVRRLAERRGLLPGRLDDWRQLPAVPAAAFKSMQLCAAPPRELFRSSGTTLGTRRSQHPHPFPDLYRAVIDASFPKFCLRGLTRPPTLSLIPSRTRLPDSSLSFMIDHILEHYAGDDRVVACGRRGVEAEAALAWCDRRQQDGQPGLVLTTALGLLQLLEGLEERGLTRALAAGSLLFETGGFKSSRREIGRDELVARAGRRLGLGTGSVVREYGMTELTSQAYTEMGDGGDPDLFYPPHWVRVQILDSERLEPVALGKRGLVAVVDLANVGSALHVLTEDVGTLEAGGGFRLLGRADGAELRGCSLTIEELAQR